MAAKTSGGSCSISWPELSTDNTHVQDAYQVFDGMTTSNCEDWRSPSRVLEVTVHQAYYPITEKVLHLLFDPFGKVEYVHVLGGSDQVLAQAVFETKYDATEAFGELHGRCVYNGCCQLDIKWGSPLECEATIEKSHPKSMASSLPNLFQASLTSSGAEEHASDIGLAVVTEIASEELNFEKLYVEVATIETQADATAIGAGAMHGEVALAVQPVANELLAHTASIIANDVVPVLNLASSASSASGIMPSNRNLSMSAPGNSSTTIQVLPMTNLVLDIAVLPGKVMLQDIINFIIPASRCVVDPILNICGGSMLMLWPLPAKCEFITGDTELRPMPWPSFILAGGWTIVWFCATFKKPPWPPVVHKNFIFSVGHRVVISMSSTLDFESDGWSLMVLIASCANLLNNYKMRAAFTREGLVDFLAKHAVPASTCSHLKGHSASNAISFIYYGSDVPLGQPDHPLCMRKVAIQCLISVLAGPCLIHQDGSPNYHSYRCRGVFVTGCALNTNSQEHGILVAQVLTMECIRPTPCPSFKIEVWVSTSLCFSLPRKPPWPPPQKHSTFVAVESVQFLASLMLVEHEPWPEPLEFIRYELIHTHLEECFPILLPVTRQWKCTGEIMELTPIEANETNCSHEFFLQSVCWPSQVRRGKLKLMSGSILIVAISLLACAILRHCGLL